MRHDLEAVLFQHITKSCFRKEMEMSRKVVVAPVAALKECVIEAAEVGGLNHKKATFPEELKDLVCDSRRVFHVFEKLKHDHGIVLVSFFRL